MNCRYTLRNAEYRLCLEKTLGVCEEFSDEQNPENTVLDGHKMVPHWTSSMPETPGGDEFLLSSEENGEVLDSERVGAEGLGEMTPAAQEYIINLQNQISSMKKVNSPFQHLYTRKVGNEIRKGIQFFRQVGRFNVGYSLKWYMERKRAGVGTTVTILMPKCTLPALKC